MHCFRTGMGEYIFIRSLTQTFPKPETFCLLHKYGVVIEGIYQSVIRASDRFILNIFFIPTEGAFTYILLVVFVPGCCVLVVFLLWTAIQQQQIEKPIRIS